MGNAANILILGADAADPRVATLEAAGYSCVTEPADADILKAIERHGPGVVLVSISTTQSLDNIRRVKSDSVARRVAVGAIDIGDKSTALRDCRDAGADDVFEDDADDRELTARMRALARLGGMESELIRRSATAGSFGVTVGTDVADARDGGHLLVVGAESGEIESLCPRLPNSGITLTAEPDPYRARSRIEGGPDLSFDGALVYVRDQEAREKCSYFCRSLRNDRRLYDLPLFLITEDAAFPDRAAAYEDGANVVAAAPVDCEFVDVHLNLLLRGRDRRRALGRRIAETLGPGTADDLGNIYSAEFARAHLDRLSTDGPAGGGVSTAILFFISTVGQTAALYGTEAAAMLRQQVASWLAALVRVEDMVGRTGTDEFFALLPHTGLPDAELVRKRVVGVLHESEFRLTDNVPVGIEIHVQSGIIELQAGENLKDAIARASNFLE